jgi:hypothetical protein
MTRSLEVTWGEWARDRVVEGDVKWKEEEGVRCEKVVEGDRCVYAVEEGVRWEYEVEEAVDKSLEE